MALFDVVSCEPPSREWLVLKHPSNELRLGTRVIVHEAQEAILCKGGQACDLFGPGTHVLSTGNLPILRALIKLPFGGKTPFPAEVWFVNKLVNRGLTWGTPGPIQVHDPKFDFPVSVRSFGKWGIRVVDSRSLVNQLVGTLPSCDADEIRQFFSGEISKHLGTAIAAYVGQGSVPVLRLSEKLLDLSNIVRSSISPEFARFGLEIVNFDVERVSIPDDEMRVLQGAAGKKLQVDQLSSANVSDGYVKMRQLDIMEEAGKHGGGGGLSQGLGLGMGLGAVSAGMQMAGALGFGNAAGPQQRPVAEGADPAAKLRRLKQMLDDGLITQEDFDKRKNAILDQI